MPFVRKAAKIVRLPLIGIDLAQHGKRHRDALMRYALERCDREKVPAYLEPTNPRNISIYDAPVSRRSARYRLVVANPRAYAATFAVTYRGAARHRTASRRNRSGPKRMSREAGGKEGQHHCPRRGTTVASASFPQ